MPCHKQHEYQSMKRPSDGHVSKAEWTVMTWQNISMFNLIALMSLRRARPNQLFGNSLTSLKNWIARWVSFLRHHQNTLICRKPLIFGVEPMMISPLI